MALPSLSSALLLVVVVVVVVIRWFCLSRICDIYV